MSSKSTRTSQFFFEEIDVTPYFLQTLPNKLRELKHKEFESIELNSINFKGTNNIYLCVHREKVKLAAVVSVYCSFNIKDSKNMGDHSIYLSTNEYETDEKDVKCINPLLKEVFIDCLNKFKEEILFMYLKDERSKLFDLKMTNHSPAQKTPKERFKNKFRFEYKITFSQLQFLDILFKPEFINCYAKILNRNNFEMELETHKIVTDGMGFHDILSKKHKFDERNPLCFFIVKDKQKYEINIIFADNLIINVFTNEEEIKFIENQIILKPFEVFRQKLIKL